METNKLTVQSGIAAARNSSGSFGLGPVSDNEFSIPINARHDYFLNLENDISGRKICGRCRLSLKEAE